MHRDQPRSPARRRRPHGALAVAAAAVLATAAGALAGPAAAAPDRPVPDRPVPDRPVPDRPVPAPAADTAQSALPADAATPAAELGAAGGAVRPFACGDGSFHAQAVREGNTWRAPGYSGPDMLTAMRAAVGSLDPGRTTAQRVVVRGSGSVPANQSLDLPSHTSLDVCGTLQVSGAVAANHAPIRVRDATDVTVGHLAMTGHPYFGVFVRNATGVTLGALDLRLSGALGVRIDNHGDRSVRTRNVRIDHVFVSGTDNHGVETYGVDGLTVGTVIARDTGYSGLLLNDTTNATVGRVDAVGAGTGTGYAAFRMANRNGRVGNAYPVNIRVGEVVARGGGRGVFCVSESGGVEIGRVDIAGTGSNAILIENCYNVNLATGGGTVAGPGDVRIASRAEFAVTRDVTLQNLTIRDTALRESPCGIGIVYRNLTLHNSARSTCG